MKGKKVAWSQLYNKYGVLLILLVEIVVFTLLSDSFFTLKNLLSIGRQVSFTGIAAVGATFLMVAGGIDLSSGSLLAFSGVLSTMLMVKHHVPMAAAILITLAAGAAVGLINGVSYTRFHISPLIATLAMQTILKGAAYLLTNAAPVYGISNSFRLLGQGYLFGLIPIPFIIMLIIFAFGFWLLGASRFGRHIYAVGGNEEAARLSGINTRRVAMIVFAGSGLFAALAGILMAGRLGSGQPSIGADFPMDVITAIVLGGVSINGGSGKLSGVLVGVLIMGILSTGMIMIGLSDYLQWVIRGVVLLFAVAVSNINSQTH
ncbi:MAG: ABC transporter permease [Eubacteriales bacterium]|nr:ABC transporter permease [Eubacteriales bacterium]